MAEETSVVAVSDARIVLDRDLAELYDMDTKYLNRATKRNRGGGSPRISASSSPKRSTRT